MNPSMILSALSSSFAQVLLGRRARCCCRSVCCRCQPKNDKEDDPSNTVLVLLGKEATVVVNGYVHGEPVK